MSFGKSSGLVCAEIRFTGHKLTYNEIPPHLNCRYVSSFIKSVAYCTFKSANFSNLRNRQWKCRWQNFHAMHKTTFKSAVHTSMPIILRLQQSRIYMRWYARFAADIEMSIIHLAPAVGGNICAMTISLCALQRR